MSEPIPARDLAHENIAQQAPAELTGLIALNTALDMARASEVDGEFIAAASTITLLAGDTASKI